MEAKRLLLGLSGATLLLALALFAALFALPGSPSDQNNLRAAANPPSALSDGLITITPSPTPCTSSYTYTVSAGTVYAGTDLVPGSQCGHCIVPLTLPFPVTFYGQTYTTATVASTGNLQFVTADASQQSCPPPYPQLGPALMPYWFEGVDLSWNDPCQLVYGLPCGIFTTLSGSPPNRTFIVNWRGRLLGSNHETVNYEIRFHENYGIIDFAYATGVMFGYSATIGVQNGGSQHTDYICNVVGNYQNLIIQWQPIYGPPCAPGPTGTSTPTPSPSPTITPSPTPCTLSYTYTVSAGTVYTGTDLVPGSQCGGCIVPLTLPFPVTFYGQTYTSANVASSGNLQFVTADTSLESCPPPYPQLGPALLPYWDDGIDLSWSYPCQMAYGLPCGIFTALSGSAPNRTFVVNWRGRSGASNHETVNYEIRFHENSATIDFIYGFGYTVGILATIGVQDGASRYTNFVCRGPGTYQFLTIQWQPVYGPPCAPSPTPTPTSTPAPSPTPSPTPCTVSYTYTVSSGAVVTATNLVPGSQCARCIVPLTLPFPVTFYGQTYTTANVASFGNLQFVTADASFMSCPPPFPQLGPALMPYWFDGTEMSWDVPCQAAYGLPCGIYTSVSGSAPTRTLNIEWRAGWQGSNHEAVHFEVRLYENSDVVDFVYGLGIQFGVAAAVGVQDSANQFTSYACNVTGNYQGITIRWLPVYSPPCAPSPTPTGTATPSPSSTLTPTPTSIVTGTVPPPTGTPPAGTVTRSPIATATAPPATATPTVCAIAFTDVHPADYFYEPVRYLYCHGVISGYADGTFRPYNDTTRGQMVKIAVNGFGFPIWTPAPAATPTFRDVPRTDPFFAYVETAAHNAIVSGYADGTFHPAAGVARGQLAKIVVVAASLANGWPLLDPPVATFADVPRGSAFYPYVETAVCHGILSGYGDGTFRPGAGATRGQIAKIEYLAILNEGTCAGPRASIQSGN